MATSSGEGTKAAHLGQPIRTPNFSFGPVAVVSDQLVSSFECRRSDKPPGSGRSGEARGLICRPCARQRCLDQVFAPPSHAIGSDRGQGLSSRSTMTGRLSSSAACRSGRGMGLPRDRVGCRYAACLPMPEIAKRGTQAGCPSRTRIAALPRRSGLTVIPSRPPEPQMVHGIRRIRSVDRRHATQPLNTRRLTMRLVAPEHSESSPPNGAAQRLRSTGARQPAPRATGPEQTKRWLDQKHGIRVDGGGSCTSEWMLSRMKSPRWN
jgi:hypothetical protein